MIMNRARILEIKIVPFILFVSIKKDSVGMERIKFFKKKQQQQSATPAKLYISNQPTYEMFFTCFIAIEPGLFLNFKFCRQF